MIGILSVKTFNYGSLLQTYALQKYITKLGYENEIINYIKTNKVNQALRLLYLPLFMDTIRQSLVKLFKTKRHPHASALIKNRNEAFAKFLEEYIYQSKAYYGRKSLINGVKKYTEILLGSDQIWHPFNYGAHFFDMSFVPDGIKKVAYAPSFGVSTIPNYQKKGMSRSICRIDSLSVREYSGRKLIKELCGRDATIVSDPTMLLTKEDWAEIMTERLIPDNYIFCYFIGDNKYHREFAYNLSKKTGLMIVNLPHIYCYQNVDDGFGDYQPRNVGPREFISLIANATYVCTDSFHGSVFSIMCEKEFFTFERFSNNKMSANSRLNTLFEKVGVTGRLLSKSVSADKALCLPRIDYEIVRHNLDEFRSFSQNWLKENI